MQLLTTFLALSTLLTAACSQYVGLNTSREYQIRTCLKPGQPIKQRFENLWLEAYHTGAGENDAVFSKQRSNVSAAGYLSPSNITSPSGKKYYDQAFNLGNEFPWQMIVDEYVNFYAAWEPVRINAGLVSGEGSGETGGFFINSTGLQFTTAPGSSEASNQFGGWLVCAWWHEAPQLFFRISYYNKPELYTPTSCADVYLIPEYI